jgi:hypothetical protein
MAQDAKQQHGRPAPDDTARWSEAIARVDRRGAVYVRLEREQRSVLLRVSAPGADARVLVVSAMGQA